MRRKSSQDFEEPHGKLDRADLRWGRRDLLRAAAGALFLGSAARAESDRTTPKRLDIRSYFSPRNRRRPKRPSTRYIILHTTEGGEKSSLKKIHARGEAHYFLTRKGRVYRIIHKSKIATHAGRSLWEGRKIIDNHGIGIEVVGYHNRELSNAQMLALRELLRQLKSVYKIPDTRVLTHSMVAYGRPNRFHRYNHRGRKRCGMIFARPDIRRSLGLDTKPEKDPDVTAGRLRVADRELFDYLFAKMPKASSPGKSNRIARGWTAWHIARESYDSADTIYVFPDGSRRAGNEIRHWDRIPVGTQVLLSQKQSADDAFEGFLEVGKDGNTAWALAGEAHDDSSTIYFLPSGMVRTGRELKRRTPGVLEALPQGTKILLGYVYGGHVKRNRLPSRIAGIKWNYPSTFYRLPDGKILSGDEIDPRQIPLNTLIFYQG